MKRSSLGAVSVTVVLAMAAAGGAATMLMAGTASGVTPPSDFCTKVSGLPPAIHLSGCTSTVTKSDPAEKGQTETNGSGTVTVSGSTATIKWTNPFEGGETIHTTFATSAKETDADTAGKCPATTTEQQVTGTVLKGSDDATGHFNAEVCVGPTGTSLEPGTKATVSEPPPPFS